MAISFPDGKPVPLRWEGERSDALPDRLPPQNIEAEQGALGSILLDPGMAAVVMELVDVADFYRDVHQIIFQAMKDLYDEGITIDAISLAEILKKQHVWEEAGGDRTIFEIIESVPHAANAKYYAGVVREHAIARRVAEGGTQLIRDVYSNQYTAPELLERAGRYLASITCEPEEESASFNPLPQRMEPAAFKGVAGDVVAIISPHTEACPEAILGQFLVAFGSVIGAKPHWQIEASTHRCNLFLCLVGPTGVARKGTSWDVARWIVGQCDPEWANQPILSGITSGEGLILQIKEHTGPLLAVETEFARTLTNASREHSSLSAVLRQAWDGSHLWVPTKNDPLYVDDAYFSMIGHTTLSDLKQKLKQNDVENGMVNRFLWMNVYRDGELPEGGDFDSLVQCLSPHLGHLSLAVDRARADSRFHKPFRKTTKAREFWDQLYRGPLAEPRTGDYAKATVRAAPLILRLAVIYAVLDHSFVIDVPHLEAANAFWRYCDATAAHVFGDPRNDENMSRLAAFVETMPAGVTRTEINRRVFKGHMTPDGLDRLLAQAQGCGLLVHRVKDTRRRGSGLWVHKKHAGS
jgi:hypothetical protein